jgi:UDP:flavonoid glycosyltransferase YjiC (YdhE family)
MSTILLTWELGGGRGHLGPLRQLAEQLIDRGHRVVLASQNVTAAGELFAGLPVGLFAAPYLPGTPGYAVSPVRSFVDILHNVGFGAQSDLAALAAAWLSIFEAVQPEAIVFDHSPTALAASYALPTRRILLGTGFACPPPGREADDLRVWKADRRQSNTRQTIVLKNLNLVRQRYRLPALGTVGDMFAQADATLLATYPELDHFGRRNSGVYTGVFPLPPGAAPIWPDYAGPRAFAYLKPHKLLDNLIAELTRQHISTLLYTGSDDPKIVKKYSTEFVRVLPSVLDLQMVMAEADFAILNGTHATTIATLLAGKPTLHFPLFLEQWMFATRVCEIDAGLLVGANDPRSLGESLQYMVGGKGVAGARSFAARYANHDPRSAVKSAALAIEATIAGPRVTAAPMASRKRSSAECAPAAIA